jgi:hypothetical protein
VAYEVANFDWVMWAPWGSKITPSKELMRARPVSFRSGLYSCFVSITHHITVRRFDIEPKTLIALSPHLARPFETISEHFAHSECSLRCDVKSRVEGFWKIGHEPKEGEARGKRRRTSTGLQRLGLSI